MLSIIANNIYAWSNTPLGKIKVVILGQDPYHGPQQAMGMQCDITVAVYSRLNNGVDLGLCFSVPPGVPTPPSLRNVSTPEYAMEAFVEGPFNLIFRF